MAQTPTSVFLAEFETKALLDLAVRAPNTYTIKMMIRGNSLLSSVFVKSITAGATLQVNYFDSTTGNEDIERYDLQQHLLINDTMAGETFRIIVPRIHNKPHMEAIVTGGTVEFGVYVSVVSDFAVDLGQAVLHLQDAIIEQDKGLPVAGYDADLDKFFFLPIKEGKVVTTSEITGSVTVTDPGTPYYLRGSLDAAPGSAVTVFTDVVPALTTRKLKQLFVTAYNDGQFSLQVDGLEIAAGLISNIQHNISFKFDPPRPILAGATIELKYTADSEPNYPCPITAFLMGFDLT